MHESKLERVIFSRTPQLHTSPNGGRISRHQLIFPVLCMDPCKKRIFSTAYPQTCPQPRETRAPQRAKTEVKTVRFRCQIVPNRPFFVQRRLQFVRTQSKTAIQFSPIFQFLFAARAENSVNIKLFYDIILFCRFTSKAPYRYSKISYTQPFSQTRKTVVLYFCQE